MKFMRREDLSKEVRSKISLEGFQKKGEYGAMTKLAREYRISRTFLYQLVFVFEQVLYASLGFMEQAKHSTCQCTLQMIFLLRFSGRSSLQGISEILRQTGNKKSSVGYVSEVLTTAGKLLPSTLSTNQAVRVFYLSDEVFANGKPVLVTVEPRSGAVLKVELAENRDAKTWKTHFEDLSHSGFSCKGMCSDRGTGLVKGFQLFQKGGVWICDFFHEFSDLYQRYYQLEQKAYHWIAQEEEFWKRSQTSKRATTRKKYQQKWEETGQECEERIKKVDLFHEVLLILQEALRFCTPHGIIRPPSQVREEFLVLFELLEEIEDNKVNSYLHTLKKHLDDLLVPFVLAWKSHQRMNSLCSEKSRSFLYLAWQNQHLSWQRKGKIRNSLQEEASFLLEVAESLLGKNFETVRQQVFEELDHLVRASSLVENANSCFRAFFNQMKGQITPEMLNLVMFYYNHRIIQSGKRKGKAPIEILTGKTLEKTWDELLVDLVKRKDQKQNQVIDFKSQKEKQTQTVSSRLLKNVA